MHHSLNVESSLHRLHKNPSCPRDVINVKDSVEYGEITMDEENLWVQTDLR